MADTGATRLVGRERHLRELRQLVEGTASGRGYGVVLSGEAGAGKTTLAEEAARIADVSHLHVAWVTCWRNAAGPLSVWTDLLEAAGAELPPPPAGPTSHPESARAARVRTMARQLLEVLGDRPTLLVVDDLQWADALSLHAIEALAGLLRSGPVGLVGTARDDDTDSSAVSVGKLAGRCRHLVVPPLTEDELATLAVELTGEAMPAGSLAVLHDRTAGNVLFAREVLAHPETQARVGGRGSSAAATIAIFSERAAALSTPCQQMVQTASVIGRRFRLDVLAEAVGRDVDALLEVIGEAESAGLVRDSGMGGFEFCHPLMAEAAYQAGGLPRRVRLHRDVGEAMERLRERGVGISAAEIAHHFARAVASGVAPRAAVYATLAGREDMDQLAYEDAVRDFELALHARELCETDDAVVADLLVSLGDAHAATGNRAGARDAYERAAALARQNGWPDVLARAALGIGSGPGGFEIPPFDRRQISLLEEAAAGATGSLRPLVLARLSVARALDARAGPRRAALSEEALRVARETGDAAAVGYALASWCDVIPGPESVADRLAAAEEILRCANAARDIRLELLGRRLRVVALLEVGRIDEIDAEVAAFASSAERIGQPVYSWYVPLWQAMRASMDGRFDLAERLRQSAASIGAAAASDNALLLVNSQRAMLQCELKMGHEPVAFFAEIIEQFPDYAIMGRPGLAYALATAGDADHARQVIATLDPAAYTVDSLGSELLTTLVMAAHAGWLAACDQHADALYNALLPHRSLFAVDGIAGYLVGSVERTLGVLAAQRHDRDLARSHFDDALDAHRQLGAPVLVAGTLRDAGACLHDAELAAQANEVYASAGIGTTPTSTRGAVTEMPSRFAFRRDGDGWHLAWPGATTHVRHTKGMADLARLLANPNAELHVLDLIDSGPHLVERSPGDAIDATARRQYRARLAELDADLEDADRKGDVALSERLHRERDALIGELSSAYGLGGRARRRGDSSERARSAVTQRIRDAIARIERVQPDLARHLQRSVRTGTFCAYQPETPVDWQL